MIYKLGRFLQLLGLLIMPVGIAGNLVRPKDVTEGKELLIAGSGLVVFLAGWLLQQSGRSR